MDITAKNKDRSPRNLPAQSEGESFSPLQQNPSGEEVLKLSGWEDSYVIVLPPSSSDSLGDSREIARGIPTVFARTSFEEEIQFQQQLLKGISKAREAIRCIEQFENHRGFFHKVSGFFFGSNHPDLFLAQVKQYLQQSEALLRVGRLGDSLEYFRKSVSQFEQYQTQYESYLADSASQESKIAFGIKFGFTTGALILTGALLAPYLPFAVGLATTGGFGGAFQAVIGLMAGGASIYSSASLIGRAFTPGEKVVDHLQFKKDMQAGALMGFGIFAAPFAGAAGQGLSAGTEGVAKFTLQNLPYAGVGSSLSFTRSYLENQNLKKAGIDAGIGFAGTYAVPAMALGMDKVGQLPQTLRNLIYKPNLQTPLIKQGDIISLQDYRTQLLNESGENGIGSSPSPISLFRARRVDPSRSNVISFGARAARVMERGAFVAAPRQAVAYSPQGLRVVGSSALQSQPLPNEQLIPEGIPTPISLSSEFLNSNASPFIFDPRDFLNMPQTFFWSPLWDTKEQRYLSFVEEYNQELFRKYGEIESPINSPNRLRMSGGGGRSRAETLDRKTKGEKDKESEIAQPLLLQSTHGYDPSPNGKTNIDVLEAMLKEIYTLQFVPQGKPFTANGIKEKKYQVMNGGSLIDGYSILYRYSQARWLRDHPGQFISQLDVIKHEGYTHADSVNYFLTHVLGQTQSLTLEACEQALRKVYTEQFEAQQKPMTANALMKMSFAAPAGYKTELIGGKELLLQYSQARWLKEHPGEELTLKELVKKKGYTIANSVEYFLREVLGKPPEVEAGYTLQSAEKYDASFGAPPDLPVLEEMLREIYTVQFESSGEKMTASAVQQTKYQAVAQNSKPIDGYAILNRYSHARWLKDHPQENINQDNALKQKGYSRADSIEYFLKNVLGQVAEVHADYTLQSANGYDFTPAARLPLQMLVNILREIYQVQFEPFQQTMTSRVIMKTNYQSVGEPDKLLTGNSLLERYSHARWREDHPQEDDMGQRRVSRLKGYTLADSIAYFLKHVLGIFSEEVTASFTLQAAEGHDFTKKAKIPLYTLEKMLLEVYRLQFESNPKQMTAKVVGETNYQIPGGKPISGNGLLNRYSQARWENDHPDTKLIQSQVIQQKGYSPAESIDHFLRSVLGYEEKVDFVLQSAEAYDESYGAKPEIQLLEGMLAEIYRLQFEPRHEPMIANDIHNTTYRAARAGAKAISGVAIIQRYSYARWLQDHPEEKDIGQNQASRITEYSPANSVKYFLKNVLGKMSFATFSQEQLESFIRSHDLQILLDLFSKDPALLISALSFLRAETFHHKDVVEFVKAYVGLGIEGKTGTFRAEKEQNSWEKRQLYILALARALEARKKLDLSEANFKSQLELLKRLSRKAFEEDPIRLIAELDAQSNLSTHPFIQRLHREAASVFRQDYQFVEKGMKTAAFGYQKAGTRFFVTHDHAINGDDPGMGKSRQAISAVEYLGLKRVLWITNASNKGNVRDEILAHSYTPADAIKILISGDTVARKGQLSSLLNARYAIVNYEALRDFQKIDPDGYLTLTTGLDAVIVDEAQWIDNAEALRSKAVRNIQSPRRWLLTATPYQNKLENIWSLLNWLDPDRYPDFAVFKKIYTESTQGLLRLHGELSDIMIRRTKRDTLTYFVSPTEIPFEEQLAHGIPRIPRLLRYTPEESGGYFLSLPQADLIAQMTSDFSGWAGRFNQALPAGAQPIDLTKLNPLQKFDFVHRAIYSPEKLGIKEPNPLFFTLDDMVAERIKAEKKLILWCWNTGLIDALVDRYGAWGVRRLDKEVIGNARDQALHDFQENPDVRILVANYMSGGVGLTLTAAGSAIFVQLPQHYPPLLQASGRIQRLIGRENIRFAKQQVDEAWLVPRFPPGFVDGIADETLREILSHGTLVEQTRGRLEGGKFLFNLLVEGFGKLEELDNYFKTGLLRALGIGLKEKLHYVPHIKNK